jgi:hypothetical protein
MKSKVTKRYDIVYDYVTINNNNEIQIYITGCFSLEIPNRKIVTDIPFHHPFPDSYY